MQTTSSSNKLFHFEVLQKLSNYIIGFGLLCYISGFIITNIYLGSLGIVNLEILKSRYILSGVLFLFFIGSIAYLLYGLVLTLRKYVGKSDLYILFKVIWYSLSNISILLFVVVLLAVLTFSISNPQIGMHQSYQINSLSGWFKSAQTSIIQRLLILIGFSTLLLLIVSIVVSSVSQKNKAVSKIPWNRLIANIFKDTFFTIKKRIGLIIRLYVFIILITIIDSAIRFLQSNATNYLSQNAKILSAGDWVRFLEGIIFIYAFLGTMIVWVFINRTSSSDNSQNDIPLNSASGIIMAIIFVMLLIVPTYAFAVYPGIPQQVGGGQIIKVEAYISNEVINSDFTKAGIDIYLIDRTTDSTIFLLEHNTNGEHKIIELKNDQILSITYNP